MYIRGIEDIWEQEIQQSPQFMQVILERSSCEQETTGGLEFTHNF
jgi:hypothetical protein